jgi:hypothetical protein
MMTTLYLLHIDYYIIESDILQECGGYTLIIWPQTQKRNQFIKQYIRQA